MTEELVTFETAKLARGKGFDENCRNMWMEQDGATAEVSAPDDALMVQSFRNPLDRYKDNIGSLLKKLPSTTAHPLHNSTLPPLLYTRPTQDLLERWLRDRHNVHVQCEVGEGRWHFTISDANNGVIYYDSALRFNEDGLYFDSFELAREAALLHALKLIP